MDIEGISRKAHEVTDCPSREELFDALRLRKEHRTVNFTFFGAFNNDKANEVEMYIFGILDIDASGNRWWVLAGMRGSGSDFLFEIDISHPRGGKVYNMGDGYWRKGNLLLKW